MKKCVMILSAHRSGSSALSGLLNQNDIHFGTKFLSPSEDNVKGFFENPSVVDLNDRILKRFDQSWFNFRGLPENWWLGKDNEIFLREAEALIEEEYGENNLIGLKDPRFSLLLDFWKYLLIEILNYELIVIILLREPFRTIHSLSIRNNFSLEHSAFITLQYLLSSLHYCEGRSPYIITFEDLLKEPKKELGGLIKKLNLQTPLEYGFLDRSLISNLENKSVKDESFMLINSLYKLLIENRDGNNQLIIDLDKIDFEAIKEKLDYSIPMQSTTNRYLFGIKLVSIFIKNPIAFIKKINFTNYTTLKNAFLEEHPEKILKNLKNLISK